jgi:hypothetical protein
MNIKIKGWEKISGIGYKGYTIVNPIHNANETKYMADVLDLNQSHKPKWELNVLGPGHKWKAATDDKFHILLWDEDKFSARREVSKDMISSVSFFRQIFEILVDEVLDVRRRNSLFTKVTPTINGNGGTPIVSGTGGVINSVQQSGNTILYNPSTYTSYSDMVNAIKEMEERIDKLTNRINGGN